MIRQIYLVALSFLILSSTSFAGKGSSKVSVFPAPPDISATVKFSEQETGKITLTIENKGKGDAFDAAVELSIDKKIDGLSFDKSIPLGNIAAGQTLNKEISLTASEDVATADVKLQVNIKETNGFDAEPIKIAFMTKSFEPPKLVVADTGIDDQSGNSRVEPMENVEMTVRIQNMGHGDARSVAVDIVTGENVYIGGGGVTHFNIGGLPAGKFRDIKFMFYTNKRIRDGEKIPVTIKINEERQQFNIAKALDLVMNAYQKRAQEIIVKAVEETKGEIKLATGLSVDIEQNLPITKAQNKDAFAVVIGNSDYRHTKNVDFAVNDARTVKTYLTEVLGFKEGNIFFISNATKGDFETYFGTKDDHKGKLFNQVKPEKSDVFIYYAGHGAPGLKDRKGYFVPVDADPQYVEKSGYSLDVFYENLSRISAKSVTVVMDSCFSGADIYATSPRLCWR
ncbi:MAG: caspase family protein [Nitrospirae bacterium]|nr:caspase family protein [Nitrospirota bacterium]